MAELRIRGAAVGDRTAIAGILTSSWGGTTVVAHATVHEALDPPALPAEQGDRVVGLPAYEISDTGLEVVSLDALVLSTGRPRRQRSLRAR